LVVAVGDWITLVISQFPLIGEHPRDSDGISRSSRIIRFGWGGDILRRKKLPPLLLPREMKIEQGPKEIIKREAEVLYYPLTTQAITKYYTR
jgi:hypothetical protein